MITTEKNVSKFNVKFATLKTIRNLINTKQNNNNLKPEAEIYTIDCTKCHKKYIDETSRNLSKQNIK